VILFPSLDRRRNRYPAVPDPWEAERARTYPPPYPAGWYHLLDSDELPPGRTRTVDCLGSSRVVSRSEADGRVSVRDGSGPDAPAWPALELHGMVLSYHEPGHPRGAAPPVPRFGVEPLADVASGRLGFRGTYDGGFVKMHLVEFADNSADVQHFSRLHGDMLFPFVGWRIPRVTVHHAASVEVDAERPHVVRFRDDAHLGVLGRELPWTGAHAEATLWGPGSLTWFRITLPKVGDVVFFQTHLPVGPLLQRVRFRVFADPRIGRLLVLYVFGNWIAQWRRDVEIWERKIHRARPLLSQGDGPLPELRRWFAQFGTL
jgi:hypothetical protein